MTTTSLDNPAARRGAGSNAPRLGPHPRAAHYRSRCGSVLPLTCLSLLALLGASALTIDVGRLATTKSDLQNACDSAALAGTSALPIQLAAEDMAAATYLSARTGGTTQPTGTGTSPRTYTVGADALTVTNPYSDARTNALGYPASDLIEVRVTRSVPMYFANALGIQSFPMTARAVAYNTTGGTVGAADGAVFANDLGITVNGDILNIGGSFYSNADITIKSDALTVADTLHAENNVKITSDIVNGNFTLEYGGTYKVRGGAHVGQYVTVPHVAVTPPITYDPASYAQDFNINYYYNSSLTISKDNYVFAPGTYYINGDLNIKADNVVATNTTFIVTGSANINADNVQLSANQNNMSIYVLGNGGINLTNDNISVLGDLYAPKGTITADSDKINNGWWVARGVTINTDNFTLNGLVNRTGATDRLVE